MKITRLGVAHIGPDKAKQMLETYPYERQRKINRNTVAYYAELMREGKWQPGSMIEVAFAPNGDGKAHGHLVNGQHRLHAVIEAETTVEFVLKHLDCANNEELGFAYGNIDTGRARNTADLLRAVNLTEEIGLNEHDARRLGAAVAFVDAGFRRANKFAILPHERIELVRRYAVAARFFVDLIAGAPRGIGKAIRRVSSFGLGLVTLDEACGVYGQERIEQFWTGVTFDDGLRVGDPRKLAHRHILESGQRSVSTRRAPISPEYSARFLANCFNAWIEDRELTMTRVLDATAPININGTRWRGR